jgi:hypothetical protein
LRTLSCCHSFSKFSQQFLSLSLYLLLYLALTGPPANAADVPVTPVTVLIENRMSSGDVASRLETPSLTEASLKWGRMGTTATVFSPKILPQNGVSAQATRSLREASVLMIAPSDGAGVQAKATAQLEAGLYRVAAMVIDPASDASTPPALRTWRMESALLTKPGASSKSLRLRPGQTLILRWTETISEARSVLQMARRTEAAKGGPTTYTGVTIAKALGQVAKLLGEVQTLTLRGNRPEAIRRTHQALLYIAQAQAMTKNRPGAVSGDDDDTAFAELTSAFSEISAAMGNLVPAESILPGKDELSPEVKISLTNAGSKPITLVTLSLPTSNDAAQAISENRRQVFRRVAPGATVTARFPFTPSPTGPASTVQFIQAVGAAVITTAPPP